MIRTSLVAVACVAALTVLAACGGGNDDKGHPVTDHTGTPSDDDNQPVDTGEPDDPGGGQEPDEPNGVQEPALDPDPAVQLLAFPLAGFNCPDHFGEGYDCDAYTLDTFDPDNIPTYNLDALPKRTTAHDGLRQPVYHDHSQLYGIGVHDWHEHRRIFAGLDRVGESVAGLPAAGKRGDVRLKHGSLADGVDRTEFQAYLTESLGPKVVRYETAPTVQIGGTPTADQVNWIVAAVELVNAALPEDVRMRIVDPLSGWDGRADITIEFRSYREFRAGAGGTTWNTRRTEANGVERIFSSRIHINDDAFARLSHRHFVTLIAHEFLHALGLGHVSSDFDTLMEATREIYRSWQGFGTRFVVDADGNPLPVPPDGGQAAIPMPMSLLYPLDREALQVLYTRLDNGDRPTSYGYWSDTSLHIAGNGPAANFGVALRNGLAQPWAHGYLPPMDLAENTELSGAAVWDGALVGLTPRGEAVTGEAAIRVSLGTLAGAASFTQLESWAPRLRPGAAGTGTTWGDGNLDYTIKVEGNTFRETGGDAGTLTGIFTGTAHEGAAGTLERTDLTAAFGGSR